MKKVDIMNLGFIASDMIAEEANWNLNLHVSADLLENAERAEYDIVYDKALLAFEDVQHLKDGAVITEMEDGRLHVMIDKDTMSRDDFRKYSTTRVGKLTFKTNSVKQATKTEVKAANLKCYQGDRAVIDKASTGVAKILTIIARHSLDLNGDGVIGAGDIALAGDELKPLVAENAGIYPYKHVVILTMDGAGVAWNPDYVYYAPNKCDTPEKHADSETKEKRINTYAMKLLNEEFAISYTAQAVIPPISAQNYFSILHGVPWMDVPQEYRLDNAVAGEYYYADYGLEEARYPSVFHAVSRKFPERQNAAFTEWPEIINGIIEPDAQVAGRTSEAKHGFFDVADYIKSPAFNNTAVVYMQNDEMDHIGHGHGYYTDMFWRELEQYDEQYGAVMEALRESGQLDGTLIITNADHGGHKQDHGENQPSDMDVFIGVHGVTVNAGERLNGGTNADIPAIALSGLRIAKPESMTGVVFDENMFLKQEEMCRKNRDIEKITFARGVKGAVLTLENPKSQTRVIDAVIKLHGNELDVIKSENGTILRQKIEGGKLKLTVSYKEQPKQLAEIFYVLKGTTRPVLEEIMLGTESGGEIYPDLRNEDFGPDTGTMSEAARRQ